MHDYIYLFIITATAVTPNKTAAAASTGIKRVYTQLFHNPLPAPQNVINIFRVCVGVRGGAVI